ncbi:MAG: YceI family protein [Pseudomonadota bacterium]
MQRILLFLALTFAPLEALAKGWTVDQERSEILFTYERAGKPDTGRFHEFAGEGFLDLGKLEATRLWIRIESSSIDLNDSVASAFATSAEWFDSKNHPLVVFELTEIEQLNETDFISSGDLTIRGKTKRVEVPIQLTIKDGEAFAKGDIQIDRSDYLLGFGPGAAFVTIGDVVSVNFDLTAEPVD